MSRALLLYSARGGRPDCLLCAQLFFVILVTSLELLYILGTHTILTSCSVKSGRIFKCTGVKAQDLVILNPFSIKPSTKAMSRLVVSHLTNEISISVSVVIYF